MRNKFAETTIRESGRTGESTKKALEFAVDMEEFAESGSKYIIQGKNLEVSDLPKLRQELIDLGGTGETTSLQYIKNVEAPLVELWEQNKEAWIEEQKAAKASRLKRSAQHLSKPDRQRVVKGLDIYGEAMAREMERSVERLAYHERLANPPKPKQKPKAKTKQTAKSKAKGKAAVKVTENKAKQKAKPEVAKA